MLLIVREKKNKEKVETKEQNFERPCLIDVDTNMNNGLSDCFCGRRKKDKTYKHREILYSSSPLKNYGFE